jgi:hypothetical protein
MAWARDPTTSRRGPRRCLAHDRGAGSGFATPADGYARSDSKANCRANSVWQTRLGLPTFCACRVLAENSYLRLTQATNSTFFGEKRIQMNRHKFKVGQTVMYRARERTSGTYKITQLMPSEGGDFQYRIRNTSEPHERVVKESDLDRAA